MVTKYKSQSTGFFDGVYKILEQIPRGKVTTYGEIARMLSAPHSSRAVGYALHFNPRPFELPCHRVINREGKLTHSFAFGGIDVQAQLLKSEGVEVSEDFTVDLNKYRWRP